MLVQDDRLSEDLPFGSRGGAAIRHYFPADGEYTVKIRLQTNLYDYIRGLGEPHQLEVRLDGARVKRFTVGGERRRAAAAELRGRDATAAPSGRRTRTMRTTASR